MKLTLLYISLITITGILPVRSAYSQVAGDTIINHSLDEVVISASRFNTLNLNTPEAIRVVNKRTISDYQLRTTPEALSNTTGVFVQKTNHGGGSLFLRGLTGNQTLLLIDGIRLSNSTMRYGPNQYFNTIDVFCIDRMEVLLGSGSVQYGSDAIGGTVQAFTKDVTTSENKEWGGSLITRVATHGMEQSANGAVNYSGKRFAFRAGITGRNFGDIVGGDTIGRQSPTGYKEFDYDLKGKILLSSKSTLTLAYQDVHQKDVPIYHKIQLENYAVNKTDPQNRKLAYAKLNHEINKGILKSALVTASYQHTDEGRETRKNGSDVVRNEFDKVNTVGVSAEVLASSARVWSGNMGFDIYTDKVNSRRTDRNLLSGVNTEKRGLYPDGATTTSMALFSVNTFDFQKWVITAGARFNTYVINVEDEASGKAKLTPSALVGNLAVMRKLNSSSNLFASINTGFRAPNIDDLGTLGIVDFRYETPNYDLKPESSVQYQLGYKFHDNNLNGEVYVYRNQIYDLITRSRVGDQTIDGYPVYQKENTGHSYIQGFETAWNFELNRHWNFDGSITYAYGQDVTNDEPVRRIPPVFGRLSAEYRFDNCFINLEWIAAGKQSRLAQGDKDDNRIPEGGTPGWNIFNINTGYSWKFIHIDLSLKNLFNADYRYHGSGVNGYGRSAFLTAVFTI